MNRKAWVLFAATSVIWGSSFLFIRVAAADMAPSAGRVLSGTSGGQRSRVDEIHEGTER